MPTVIIFTGLIIATATFAAMPWSVAYPGRRLWPPKRYTMATPILVWAPTFPLFGILIGLGVMEWGNLPILNWLRFGVCVPLIGAGNVVEWTEAAQFGSPKPEAQKDRSGQAACIATPAIHSTWQILQ
nr:hypothetical protein [uncultured Shimia sp.]